MNNILKQLNISAIGSLKKHKSFVFWDRISLGLILFFFLYIFSFAFIFIFILSSNELDLYNSLRSFILLENNFLSFNTSVGVFFLSFNKSRSYSSNSNFLWNLNLERKNSVLNSNMGESKRQIYQACRPPSGGKRKIRYLFTYGLRNRESGNSYIGSSLDLFRRMRRYFFEANSSSPNNLIIVRALRKYGISQFSLIILTFCNSEQPKVVLELEQLALNLFKPIYNILSIAGLSSGFAQPNIKRKRLSDFKITTIVIRRKSSELWKIEIF